MNSATPASSQNAKTRRVSGLTSDRLHGWKRVLPVRKIVLEGRVLLRPRWRECLGWAAGFAFFGWICAAGAAWSVVKFHRGIAEARYIDVVIPSRWPEFRRAIGNHAIVRAEKLLEEGKGREAMFHLRSGVARSPGNARGRLHLAALYNRAGRPDLARETLLSGVEACAHDVEYLQTLFRLLLQQQADDLVLQTADQLFSRSGLPLPCRRLAADAAASAMYLRGHYDRAERIVRDHQLSDSLQGRLLLAKLEWERGYRDLALVQLRALSAQAPRNSAIRAELRRWLQELGHDEEFRRLCLAERLADPGNVAARIDLLRAYHKSSPAQLPAEIATILQDFATDGDALAALAAFGASIGDVALAQQVFDHCVAHELPWQTPAFLHVEALIVARQHQRALEVTRDLFAGDREWPKNYEGLFNSLQAIAYYGMGDTASAELYLLNFLALPGLRAESLLRVAQRFEELGGKPQAHRTLTHAADSDPLNQAVLTRLIELDIELGKTEMLPEHLERLVKMRRPKPAALTAARQLLATSAYDELPNRAALLGAIDDALAVSRGSPASAAKL